MNLLSIGISHHTASVELREKMWMSADEVKEALAELNRKFFNESVIISTCNRTELYGITPEVTIDDAGLRTFLIDFKHAASAVRPEHFSGSFSGGAINHLFKVASGVDSMVVGDIQILNQVKEAFQLSREMSALGPVMSRLMQATLHVGKRVRTETSICEGAVSVSYAAVELASKIFEDLSKKSALLIGAGETGELTMRHLTGKGIGELRVANRTRARAESIVAQLGGSVVDYEDIADALVTADIVITSVASPSYIVQPADVHKVMKQRSHNPLFIIDTGVPRNVDPSAARIENVFLYDIDSLGAMVDTNLDRRKQEIPKVNSIIREEMVEFFHWHNSLAVGPAIHDLRDAIEAIRRDEVGKNINRFAPEDRELLEIVTKRIINKILHQPVTNLKQGAENGLRGSETQHQIRTIRELFGLPGRKTNG